MLVQQPPLTPSATSAAPVPLPASRLHAAKAAYTTRHLDLSEATGLVTAGSPRVGDVVLARVDTIGQHQKIELVDGRRAALFPGDEVVVVYGHRYAPDQFEAGVPGDLGPCDLVAAGGVAARVEHAHGRMGPATGLHPVGLLVDDAGQRLTMARGVLPAPSPSDPTRRPLTLAVVGASMNSGKTTTAASLVRGLRAAGLQVGAAKTTGTGAGGDVWLMSDAGAFPVYDFTSAGLPSTYRVGAATVRSVFVDLTDRLAEDGCDVVVLEIADGVYQQETAALVTDPVFAERVDGLLFAGCDALSAAAGVGWLEARGLTPLALSGVLSSSPLATREAQAATGHDVWGLPHLQNAASARALYERLREGRRSSFLPYPGTGDPR